MNNSIAGIVRRYHLLDSKRLRRFLSIRWEHVAAGHIYDIEMINQNKVDKMTNQTQKQTISSFSFLQETAPGFPVDASKITIIKEPADFYSTLMEKSKTARYRITMASLYLGTGKLEADLVECIKETVTNSNGKVKVKILLDFMRGSRGQNNSRKMLQPLLEESCVNSCKIYLYHTPRLRGFLKSVMPNRFNELIGLQHMKVYIFDDSLIISGANLSNDYFTNRQDRYFLIENCKDLCDFYNNLTQRVTEFSFRLLPGNITTFENAMHYHPLQSSVQRFSRAAREKISSLYTTEMEKCKNVRSETDTWVFPLVQMGQLGISQDSKVTLKLLENAPAGASLRLATSYFNLTSKYSDALLRNCQASCQLLTAHPTANGFFKAKGIAGGIPAAYTTIEKSFYKKVKKMGLEKRIELVEFDRPGWTYHAKGLWYTLPNHSKPSLTLIGSSNFGYRSVKRDLESQIVLVTTNQKLQTDLEEEYARLYRRSRSVTEQSLSQRDRIAPIWVCAAASLFRYFF